MRIIGSIDHQGMKITVFQHDGRVSVKFETGLYEQVYYFRTGGLVNNLEEAKEFVSPEFVNQVLKQFEQMHRNKTARLGDLHEEQEGFDEII